MEIRRRLGRFLGIVLILLGILIWGVALLLFSQVAENSDDFANYALVYVVINAIGVAVLIVLIGNRLIRLVRDYRRFVPGSRLQARVVSLVVIVAAIPLVILYMFSVAFIMRGIDQWLDIDVGEGLNQALALGSEALEQQRIDALNDLALIADRLALADTASLAREIDTLAMAIDATELTLLSRSGEVLAHASTETDADDSVPAALPDPESLPYASLELQSDGYYFNQVQAAVLVDRAVGEDLVLHASFDIPESIHELTTAIDQRHQTFSSLAGIRVELKASFAATLSLVLLVSILGAVYAAFFAAGRLILPIQQLMKGTRAVARGDFDTRVPLAQGDEIGFLVNSFNNMTNRLAVARQEAHDSEQRLESERSKLALILARLSTGVVSLEPDLTIRTANSAAGQILGIDPDLHVGESLVELAKTRPMLRAFLDATANHLDSGDTEWREQISLRGEQGNRELVCACSELPAEGEHGIGYILVFDDISVLIQAQKEAAWGEVARRLAHEIKNPLTPIQLSAERVRRRYLSGGKGDIDLLDRATHTIIQQVDAMKTMVDAFSEYARSPEIELGEFDLNDLIGEVTELYRHQEPPVAIVMNLDRKLPLIEADVNKLRQVLHNLLRNASEAVEGQADAEIEITTRWKSSDDGDFAAIVVADNGPGFSADIMDQVFLPYVTSKTRGTGLGLAIVRKLVDEHGGSIEAINRTPRGAEVSILLPLKGAGQTTGRRTQHRRKRA